MKILRWTVLLTFTISRAGRDRRGCATCGGGPLNSPGAKALYTCALNCIQTAPAGTQCENNPSSDCICNGAHYNLAAQAIANCAVASCNIAQDGAAATSIASTWCAQWSQTAAPALVTPYTNILTTPVHTPSTTTSGHYHDDFCHTAGSGGGNGGGEGGGLSRWDKISLGVGIGIGLPGSVQAIWQMCKWLNEDKRDWVGSGDPK